MASSGWLGEQTLATRSSNIRYVGDVRIDSIVRNTNNVVVSGAIRLGSRGTSGYCGYYNYGVQTRVSGGSWQEILGGFENLCNGNNKEINFSTTISASASATSAQLTIDYKACYNSSCSSTYWTASPSWTIYFDQAVSPPSDLNVSTVSGLTTWNSVRLHGTVGSYGSPSSVNGRYIEIGLTDNGSSLAGRRCATAQNANTLTATITNSSSALGGGITLKGMTSVYPYVYANNTQASAFYISNAITLPPAPGILSYSESAGSNYTINYTGDPSKNNPSYSIFSLRRIVRYRDSETSEWTVVANGNAPLDIVTTETITIPAGHSVIVEAWMTYNVDLIGEKSIVTIANTSNPISLLGSVNGESRKIEKLYGSVNGRTKEITKLYGSVDGVAKLIYEKQ